MLQNHKNLIIIFLFTIIVLLIIAIFLILLHNHNTTLQTSRNKNIDGSNMSPSELTEMLKSEGYELSIINIDGTISVDLENEMNGITFQKIYNTLLGTMMTYDDDSINDEMADLIELDRNNTDDKQAQYRAYESWMKKYNITKTQLSKIMDDYYDENKNTAERINTNELINSYNY